MKMDFIRAGLNDAKELWEMQLKSFTDLLAKYQDYETSPGNESFEKTQERLKQDYTYYYYICVDKQKVGAIRIVDLKQPNMNKRISPLYILPPYRGQGFAQMALRLCEDIHGPDHWQLYTIKQERGNCYLYEKMGYHTNGTIKEVNDKMTLVLYEK